MRTLVCLSASAQSGWSLINVDEKYADSLQRHIRALHLGVTPLRESPAQVWELDTSRAGPGQVSAWPLGQCFEAQASPHALSPVIAHWLKLLALQAARP